MEAGFLSSDVWKPDNQPCISEQLCLWEAVLINSTVNIVNHQKSKDYV